MKGLFSKIKDSVTTKLQGGKKEVDNETMTIMSDNSLKSTMTTTSSMASPFKSPNQFNKLSSKSLKDLYEKLPDFKRDQIKDVGYLLSKVLAEYFASMILGYAEVSRVRDFDDEEIYFEMREICIDLERKFKSLYSRLDQKSAEMKKEDAKDSFLDDLDSDSPSKRYSEEDEYMNQLSSDPNVRFEINLKPTISNFDQDQKLRSPGSVTESERSTMSNVFSSPLSIKFEHFRMKDLRSRKSVVRGMLWALGSEKEEEFQGRHKDDVSFKVRRNS